MIAQQVRDEVALIGTGGDDDIVRLDRAVGGLGDEACAVTLRQPRHRDAAADRRRDEVGIGLDESDDVVRVGKAHPDRCAETESPAAAPTSWETGISARPSVRCASVRRSGARSSTRCESPRSFSRWLITSPAWPPPITSVSIFSSGMSLAPAARGGLCRGADDPAPERGEIALPGAEAAIDQIPAHAFRHA